MYMGLVWLAALTLSFTSFGADHCEDLGTEKATRQVYSATSPDTVKNLQSFFAANCMGCHGPGNKRGPIKNISDLKEIKSLGYVDTKTPENSTLYQVVATGKMPKGAPLVDKELEDAKSVILAWLKAGAPEGENPSLPMGHVSYQDEVKCIAQDADKLSYADGEYARYLVLSTAWNSGRSDLFYSLVDGLNLGINGVSNSDRLVRAKKLGKHGIVVRIDLRDYGLSTHQWDQIVAKYEYGIEYFDKTYVAAEERDIAQNTRTARAWLRADWFLQEIQTTELYYDLQYLPKTLHELELKVLGIDTDKEIASYASDRLIIRRSGVTNWNRVVDRYDLDIYAGVGLIQSSYWKTFDVENEVHLKNFFGYPFGPASVKYGFATSKVFQHDAGEMIFKKRNRLQAYYIANAKGQRLQEAPLTVAVDKANHLPYVGSEPNVVLTAVSCNHCHAPGLNGATDQVRKHVERTAGFSVAEMEGLFQLVKEQSHFDKKVAEYNKDYQDAVTILVDDPKKAFDPATQPIWTSVRHYFENLSVTEAAAELTITEDAFKNCMFRSPDLAAKIGLSDPELGRVSRDQFEKYFADLVVECNVGKKIVFKAVNNHACNAAFYNTSGRTVKFKVGSTQYQVNHNANVAVNHKTDLVVADVWHWDGHRWITYHDRWTAAACTDFEFRWNVNRVKLFKK